MNLFLEKRCYIYQSLKEEGMISGKDSDFEKNMEQKIQIDKNVLKVYFEFESLRSERFHLNQEEKEFILSKKHLIGHWIRCATLFDDLKMIKKLEWFVSDYFSNVSKIESKDVFEMLYSK